MSDGDLVKDNKGPFPLQKLPHVIFFPGGVVIKIGDEVIGAIGRVELRDPYLTQPVLKRAWRRYRIA